MIRERAAQVIIRTEDGRDIHYTAPCVVTIHPPATTADNVDAYFQELDAMTATADAGAEQRLFPAVEK